MGRLVLIALAGAAGALCRLGANNLIGTRPFPAATLAVNVVGCFALGLVAVWGATRMSPEVVSALSVGFLGAFTTFSAFALEAVTLEAADRLGLAFVYVACSVALGLVAAAGGQFVGRSLL
jgi:CrcB protein